MRVALLVDLAGGGPDADYKFSWAVEGGVKDTDHEVAVAGLTKEGNTRTDSDGLVATSGETTLTGSGESSDPADQRYYGKFYLLDKATGEILDTKETWPMPATT